MFRSLYRGLLYGGDLFLGLLYKVAGTNVGGTVCGTLSLTDRVAGDLDFEDRVTGSLTFANRVTGTLSLEEC